MFGAERFLCHQGVRIAAAGELRGLSVLVETRTATSSRPADRRRGGVRGIAALVERSRAEFSMPADRRRSGDNELYFEQEYQSERVTCILPNVAPTLSETGKPIAQSFNRQSIVLSQDKALESSIALAACPNSIALFLSLSSRAKLSAKAAGSAAVTNPVSSCRTISNKPPASDDVTTHFPAEKASIVT